MIELSKKYARPLLVGASLVVVSSVWACGQRADWEERELHKVSRHAQSLAKGLGMLVDGLEVSTREGDARLAEIMKNHLTVDGPVRFAQLRRGDDHIVYVGEGDGTLWTEGFYESQQLQVERIELNGLDSCDQLGGDRPDPPLPWSWCAELDTTGEPLELWVGMDVWLPPHVHREMRREVWSMLLLAWTSTLLLMLAWVRDIRARELRDELAGEQLRLERLEEQNLAAAGLAHETKNPLGLILGLAQRLAEDETADIESRDVAEQIMDEADRANARLSDFLNFAGLRRPNLVTADVEQVCGRVVGALRGDFVAGGVTLESSFDDGAIECDVGMLEQVLVNLLLNSLSASEEGSTTRVSFEVAQGLGVLRVQDEGSGIAPGMLGDVFKPYITGRPDGHGLGLSVVRKIVEQHGWSVDVESAPGLGATFEVRGIVVVRRKV